MSLHLPFSLRRFLLGSLVVAASASSVSLAQTGYGNDPGGIIFIGDSITQGGNFLQGAVASYRYQLFKNFVDNGVEYKPMGTTQGASQGYDVSSCTPDYQGQTFTNVSEAAASGRSYQFSGYNGRQYYYDADGNVVYTTGDGTTGYDHRLDPGTVMPEENRGPLSVKLGLTNPYTGTTNTYHYATTSGATPATREYTGDTYADLYGETKAQTACIMIGINDIIDMGTKYHQTHEHIIENIHQIVKTLQEYNPDINVVVMGCLPVGSNNGAHDKLVGYNDLLKATLEDAETGWSTATSQVIYADVSTGFYAENGAMIDGTSGAHPNAQGELIVAGNIARVLGVGQRTLGYERKAGAELASQADLSTTTPSISISPASRAARQSTVKNFEAKGTAGAAAWTAEDSKLTLAQAMSAQKTAWLQLNLDATDGVRVATYDFTLQMNHAADATDAASNVFTLFFGDGVSGAGALSIGEDGIYWGTSLSGTLLYGAVYNDANTHTFTLDSSQFRVVVADNNGTAVFNVWLGDQLIGENLASQDLSTYKDAVLFGKIGSGSATYATLSSFSMELGATYAPSAASIPEPATATLSLLALAGLAARRRRK